MKSRKVDFTPPEELLAQVGEQVQPGTRLELMTTFAVKPDGKWCIATVEGVPFPGYDADGNPKESEDEKPMETKSEFAGRYQNEMGMGGGY